MDLGCPFEPTATLGSGQLVRPYSYSYGWTLLVQSILNYGRGGSGTPQLKQRR